LFKESLTSAGAEYPLSARRAALKDKQTPEEVDNYGCKIECKFRATVPEYEKQQLSQCVHG
jgi:hypothetical protein